MGIPDPTSPLSWGTDSRPEHLLAASPVTSLPTGFFFTEPDPDLQQTGSRDPLGFEILWTHFGARVVPHFSTVSRGAINFGACLTLIWLVDSYLEKRQLKGFRADTKTRPARDGLLVVAETLSVLSAIRHFGSALSGGVLGSLNGRRRLQQFEGAPPVGPFADQQLLARQLNLGVFGRYRGALYSMGVLDGRTHLTHAAKLELAETLEYLEPLQSLVHSFFDKLVEADEHECSFDDFAQREADGHSGSEWMAALRKRRVRKLFAPVLVDAARVAPNSDTLIRRIYSKVSPEHSSPADTDALFAELEKSLQNSDERERVKNVRRLEEILQRFDRLFDHLWSIDHLDEASVRTIVEDLLERADDLDLLLNRSSTSGMVRERLEGLAKVLEQATPLGVVAALVEQYHRDIVAESRGATPWVAIESGRVTVLNSGYAAPAKLDRRGWRRAYYVPSVADFKREIEEVYQP